MEKKPKPYNVHLPLYGSDRNMILVRARMTGKYINTYIADLVIKDLEDAGLRINSAPKE